MSYEGYMCVILVTNVSSKQLKIVSRQDVRCNCDAGEEIWRLDEGTLTDRRHLPVTKLNFGHLEEEHQQATFLLGPLYCYGASHPPRTMTSCQETLQ